MGGDHYKNKAIQPIDFIMANKMDFCEGCIIKYITRWREKGGVDDLRKAKQYIDFIIEDELPKESLDFEITYDMDGAEHHIWR